MTPLTAFLTILGMGLITFGQRLSFILLADRLRLPPLVRRGLRYVPPAVLSAIIFPDVFLRGGILDLSPTNPHLPAGLAAAAAAYLSKNILVTLVTGMGVLWLWNGLILN